MSDLFKQSTEEIQRIGNALKIDQNFRQPFQFGLNINGRRAAGFTGNSDGGNVDVAGTPGFSSNMTSMQGNNTAANNRLGGLITGLQGNQNPFIQARVRPFQELARENTAAVTRDVGRRSIQGSLGQNQISNAKFLGGREVADQGVLATQESLGAQLAAEGTRLGVGEEAMGLANLQMKEEFQNIQTGMDALKTALANQVQTSTQLDQSSANTTAGNIATGTDIIGEMIKLFGGFFKKPEEETA